MNHMKKHLSMPSLLHRIRCRFAKLPDTVKRRSTISLSDCLMSGLAVFGLKMPSLLQFEENLAEEEIRHNLKNLYGVANAPCDTYLRERLDEVEPGRLRRAYGDVFSVLQRQKVLSRYDYYDGHYLLSLDGTNCFSSHQVHCESCCVKEHRDGKKTYYHQLLAAVIVHPDEKTVIPLAPEPIVKQADAVKNDGELTAAKRLLVSTRREHPHLKFIVVEDALYANAQHIALLKQLNMSYILSVKPKSHPYLFEFFKAAKRARYSEQAGDGTVQRYEWVNGLPLNATQPECEVNLLCYECRLPNGQVQRFSWITPIALSQETVYLVMRGGRARWHIENETFNTLKTQGYHFEHNYGHGYKHLSTVMAMLMFLAFLLDQAQEMCCEYFQRALKKAKRKRYFWEKLRVVFTLFKLPSWEFFYEGLVTGFSGASLIQAVDTS